MRTSEPGSGVGQLRTSRVGVTEPSDPFGPSCCRPARGRAERIYPDLKTSGTERQSLRSDSVQRIPAEYSWVRTLGRLGPCARRRAGQGGGAGLFGPVLNFAVPLWRSVLGSGARALGRRALCRERATSRRGRRRTVHRRTVYRSQCAGQACVPYRTSSCVRRRLERSEQRASAICAASSGRQPSDAASARAYARCVLVAWGGAGCAGGSARRPRRRGGRLRPRLVPTLFGGLEITCCAADLGRGFAKVLSEAPADDSEWHSGGGSVPDWDSVDEELQNKRRRGVRSGVSRG